MSEHQNQVEWSAEERAALREMAAGMPGAEAASAELEERLVGRLRRRGLLAAPAPRSFRPGRWTLAAALLVALLPAVFLAGMVTGQRAAARATAAAFAEAFDDNALAAAARVQETASAHLTALAALAALSDEDPERVAQGREAARAALHATVMQMASLDPEDSLARRLARLLEAAEMPPEEGEPKERQVVWF